MGHDWPRSDDLPGEPQTATSPWPVRGRWPTAARSARAGWFTGELSRDAAGTLLIVTLTIALIPLAVVRVPPLEDYPFHLARISIIDHWSEWPGLHAIYQIRSFMLPNIAMDVILLAAAKLMPVEVAGRAFVALTLITMMSGAVALYRSLHGRYALWPFVAALVLHNWIFVFGFLNYLFGIGLMLWGLAIWMALVDRPIWQRLLAGSVIALAIYFAHMVSFGLYAVLVAGYELQRAAGRLRREPRGALGTLLVAALPFLPPLLLFVLTSPTSREVGSQFKYQPEWYWKGFVVARTFMSMNLGLDLLTAGVLLIAAIVVLLGGRIVVARGMLLGLALLVVTFLALPWKMFGAVFVDARLPVALIFVAIACLRVELSRPWIGRVLYLMLGATLLVRSVVLAGDWMTFDRTYAAIARALELVPKDGVILEATAAPLPTSLTEWMDRWRPPIAHAASIALLEKPAFAVNTWATPTQQPIGVAPAWSALYQYQEQNPKPVESTSQLAKYIDHSVALIDRAATPAPPIYLVLLYPDYLNYPTPPALSRVADGPRFVLYRVDR